MTLFYTSPAEPGWAGSSCIILRILAYIMFSGVQDAARPRRGLSPPEVSSEHLIRNESPLPELADSGRNYKEVRYAPSVPRSSLSRSTQP